MQPGLGWLRDDEHLHASQLMAITQPLTVCAPPASQIPASFDPSFLKVENQGQTNTCSAHAVTTAAEGCYYIATRGQGQQFSRRAAYAWAKEVDYSSPNQDGGATISAVALVAQRIGFCTESLVPWYPGGRYVRGVPNEMQAKDEAAKRKCGSLADLRTYDQLDQWLTSGAGWVVAGIDWTSGWAALLGADSIATMPGGMILGGHAICFGGWATRAGERWPYLINSHGEQWGQRGKILVSPRVVDTLVRNSRFGFKGLSDLSVPEAREWDWLGMKVAGAPKIEGMY